MTAFESRNPDFERVVRDSFDRQGLMKMLGAELAEIAPGRAAIVTDYHDGLGQQHGFFHGGVIGAIADSAGGYAAFSLMPPESNVLTVEYKMNIVAPGRGRRLVVGALLATSTQAERRQQSSRGQYGSPLQAGAIVARLSLRS